MELAFDEILLKQKEMFFWDVLHLQVILQSICFAGARLETLGHQNDTVIQTGCMFQSFLEILELWCYHPMVVKKFSSCHPCEIAWFQILKIFIQKQNSLWKDCTSHNVLCVPSFISFLLSLRKTVRLTTASIPRLKLCPVYWMWWSSKVTDSPPRHKRPLFFLLFLWLFQLNV